MADNLRQLKCGICSGKGRYTEADGVGGKWEELCYQCRGKGTVLALVSEPDSSTDSDVRFSLIELE